MPVALLGEMYPLQRCTFIEQLDVVLVESAA
jgi:hypothetical protein